MAQIPGALPLLAVLGAVAFTAAAVEGLEWDPYQVVRPPGRFFHSSTTDPSGDLYIVGGISSTLHNLEIPSCLSDTWVLRRNTQRWEQLSPSDASGSDGFPPHSGASLVYVMLPPPTSIPLLLLVGGNLNYPCSTASVQPTPAGDRINHMWVMDVASGMWKTGTAYPDNKNGFPLARSYAAVVAVPGEQKVIMAGGLSAATVEILADVWELDLSVGFSSDSRGVWRRIGDLPFPLAYGAAMYHAPSDSIFIQGGLIIEEGDEGGMQQKPYDGLLEVKLLPGGGIEMEEKSSSGIFRMYHSGWAMQIEGVDLLAVSGGSIAEVSDSGPALENSTLQFYDIQEGLWLPEAHGLVLPNDESPPSGLIGATATALEVEASGAIVFGGISDNDGGELLHDGSETFQFHVYEDDSAYWRRLGFTSPVPRVDLNAVMLGGSRMLIQGGCHPSCEPRIPSTLLTDLWVLNRPQDGSLGWGWLVSGLPSWGNVDSRSNMWSRVVTSDEGSRGPGQRFLHTMVADSESSAILFGGVMPQVANQPAFNYEVWRLSIAGEGTEGVVPGAWTMVPTTFATNPFNPFGTYRPPVIGHSATVDGDGNMLVFGGYDGALLEQGSADQCKLASSLWRLILNQDPTKTSVWEELFGPGTSMNTDVAPAPRLHHTCQYLSHGSDSLEGVLWCHGGVACSNDLLGDTWGYSFSSGNWFELERGTTPGRRAGHSMVELSSSQLILTGGYSDPVNQIPRSDVWMLDSSCDSRSPVWRELYPAKGVARAQHASVNLGGGLLSMVAGQVPADDPSWYVTATWNTTANVEHSVRLTNSIAVMDLAACFPTSTPCVNDEDTVCSAAPYKVDAMVQLLPPGEDSPAPGSSQAPSCIVSMQRMAIVVTDEHGSVLASCNTPDDMLTGDGVTSCRWSTDSSTMERTLEATGIGMRERRMPLIVEATMGGVTVAQSQPLDVTASLIGENNLMSLMLELWKPAVLLFALMRGGQPIAGVQVTLLSCRSPESCFAAYDPAAYPDGCVPLVTNVAGTANFYIWPPLRENAYGFRVRASVDGITYYSKRILPELLHPNRTWQESLSIPSGITCTTNVDLSLEGINLLGTTQLIWPIVQLQLVQVATGIVIKSSLESLNSLSNTAYSTLIRSSRKVWPLKWEEEGLDVDIQSDYVVQAIAYGSQGGWVLAQSRQVRSADYVSHSLTFQMELRFSLISVELAFPTCDTILSTLGEASADCSTANLPVAGATVLVKIGPVEVNQQSYSDLLWQVRRRSSRRMMMMLGSSGPANDEDEPGLGGSSRKLLQSRQFQWEHSVGSNSLGQAKIGVFLSSQLPETAPQISLEVLYGGLPLYIIEDVPRGPAVDLGQIIVGTPLLCINRVLSSTSGSFPVADLGQLANPQRAVPPGHGCRYQIQPTWDTPSRSGYIGLTIHYHLLYSSGSDEDTLVIKSIDNAGNVAEQVTCRRTGCGSLRVDSNQLGSAHQLEFQNVVSVNVEFKASAVSPAEAPYRGFFVQYYAMDAPPPSAAYPPIDGGSIGPSAPSSRGGIDNQAVIEVLTAGTVSAVLLLLMICCVWKICWIRWQRQGLVGHGPDQSNSLDAYVELMSSNGMQNHSASNGEPGDGSHGVQATPMGRYRRRKGVPSRVIAQIPSHVHSCSISQDGGDNPEEQDCCSICLEDYENGVVLRTLPCMHQYHDACILGWLQRNTTCPLCKYVVYERKERDRSHGSSRPSPNSSEGSINRVPQMNRIESGNSDDSNSPGPSPTADNYLIPTGNSDMQLLDAEHSADGPVAFDTPDSLRVLLPGSIGDRD